MQWRELLHSSKTNRTRRRWSVKFRRRTRMVRFAMQAFGNASPHQRPAKRSRSEALVELPSSPPLPPQLQEDEHQLSATFDPDTLDCNICMESLAAPIFQCSNGHIACSSCCQKLNNVCASCSKPTGKIRCLAIEKLIESLHMSCRYAEYGCQKMLKFTKKKSHETSCPFAPFKCPVSGCSFSGAAKSFPDHFSEVHQTRTLDFLYDVWFTVVLNPTDLHVLLKADDMVFLLHFEKETLGNIAYVTFFGAPHREEFFTYHLEVKSGQTRLTMESVPRSIMQEDKRSTNFVLIPRPLHAPEGSVQVELIFKHPGEAISGLQINP